MGQSIFRWRTFICMGLAGWLLSLSGQATVPGTVSAETAGDYSLLPPFVTAGVPPLVMLVLGRDHKLYYEAYNDASDLNGDGSLDIGYKPDDIDYYGYFDSYKCYSYSNSNTRFEPQRTTTNKKCTVDDTEWSGDFLNYLTMSRMDTMRKVLYGGYRSTDTATETVLQRAYIPQDAHSWGKEYESIARDGYDIREYSPLGLPQLAYGTQTRHLLASTTLSDNGNPLLRVLPDNTHRIWEWVAKERPVVDNSLQSTAAYYDSYPANHAAYDLLVQQFATADHLQGTPAHPTQINGSGNPCSTLQDHYLTIFTARLVINLAGAYQFAVDGDDAVEVIIDGNVVAGWYGGHGRCTCATHSGVIDLSAGGHTLEFRHQERAGDDNYYLRWNGPDSGNAWQLVPAAAFSNLTQTVYDVRTPSSTITDYVVRVKVGVASMPESNCRQYPAGVYKPTGLLQRHGESDRMYFGLVTGSYDNNTAGGILRKNIGTITDEINASTGQFTAVNGIIKTIDKLRIKDFAYPGTANYEYNVNCGWVTTRPINAGECRMWGNPVAEMMYETLRYYSGAASATGAYSQATTTDDSTLGLPVATWQDPYAVFSHCAKPFMLVISDINPNYDSDHLPGSAFGSFSSSTLGAFNAQELANTISAEEAISGTYYIGQSSSTFDTSCSPKSVAGMGNIRGLCPEEPTKQGGYYAASVAYHGLKEDIHASAQGAQNVATYAVGLASPLPRIEIPAGGKTVTLVPFAKSVAGWSISATRGQFQPTNTIVDFFVETITPTYGRFRINFEDVEQGADHDMDAIAIYEYYVNNDATVTINLTSEYAAGSIVQHMGYIISGTTADGTYLEIRDTDTTTAADVDYFLDTPPGIGPNTGSGDTNWDDNVALPLTASRTFTPGNTTAATLLRGPLWYAAKWGGFEDANGDHMPDMESEWDKDQDGEPDTYFYVTNPLRLEEQLNRSFADILRRTSSGTAASVISSSRFGEGAVYQAIFYPEFRGSFGNAVNWVGELHAYLVDAHGNMREDTNHNHQLDVADDKFIEFSSTSVGTVYKYVDTNSNGRLDASERSSPTIGTMADVAFLWSSSSWLNEIADGDITTQRSYAGSESQRHIFTFIDGKTNISNLNMIPDTGEIVDFVDSDTSIYPYLHLYPPFLSSAPLYIENIRQNYPSAFNDFVTHQSQRVINYIRGQDQTQYTSSTTPSYTIPAFRNRQVDYDDDGELETWRLGDVVYSTPTVVGPPAEDFDLLYKDDSYRVFSKQYKNRRNMIYAGGNDGMLHAFNGGFYDRTLRKFWKAYNPTATPRYSDGSGSDLGAERWAYIPYNLLPHLYWLTEPSYNQNVHVAYVDLKPRVFDAKIFADDTTHPGGWGTVLVGGMRFGGGTIRADLDKTDGLAYRADVDRTMTSAFFIFDITDAEAKPTLLAEVSSSDMGFTTCYPTVITMKDLDPSQDSNVWYLVLGSGPIGTHGADSTALADGTSNRSAKIVLLNLKELATNHEIWTLDGSSVPQRGIAVYSDLSGDANSFVSDPVSVDFDLDYRTDAVYFGTVSGDYASATGWGGKLRRIVLDDDTNPANWSGDSTLIDLTDVYSGVGQPIVAAPSIGMDGDGQRWLFVGTGRFFNRQDASHATASHQQSYYGLKEPYTVDGAGTKTFTWATVNRANLLDVTDATVFEGGTVQNMAGVTDFNGLKAAIDARDGWFLDFGGAKERNLGQAALLGNILTFTTYLPSIDPCQIEGTSNFYALYYGTGSAYTKSVIGLGSTQITENGKTKHEVLKVTNLGQGLTISPNIHTGREQGSKAYVQTSTGTILEIEEHNPGMTKSGKTSWEEWRE